MKRILLPCALLLCSMSASAENIHFGIRTFATSSDISLTRIKDRAYYRDEQTGPKVSLSGGFFLEIPLFKYASVQGEVLSSGAGYTHRYTDFGLQQHSYNLRYLTFPVSVKARIKGVGIYGGVQYGILQKAKLDMGANMYGIAATSVIGDHQDNEWALVYGVEYTAPFGLGVTCRYQYGLTNMAVNRSMTYRVDDKITNRVIQFGLYFRFLK